LDSPASPPGLARLSQVDKMKKLADGGKLTEKQEKVSALTARKARLPTHPRG